MILKLTIPSIKEVEIELPLIVRNQITGEAIQVTRKRVITTIFTNTASNRYSSIQFEQLDEIANNSKLERYLDYPNHWEKITSGEFADILNKVLTDNL